MFGRDKVSLEAYEVLTWREKEQYEAYPVYQRKSNPQAICYSSSSFCTASVRTNHHSILEVRDLILNVILQKRSSVEIIDRDIEEALILRVMEVHCDDMICASAG